MEKHAALSDRDLMARLSAFCLEGRRNLGRILVDLAEVEARNAHVEASFTSMFDYCLNGLHMSHGEAARRLSAARIVRRFPWVVKGIEDGRLHLSALRVVAAQMDEPHFETLLRELHGKTKAQAFELCAKWKPKPDVSFSIAELPTDPEKGESALASSSDRPKPPPAEHARVAPLSEDRFAMTMTITRQVKDKLEYVRSLTRHGNPSGDARVIFEAGLDALIVNLEKKLVGKGVRPQKRRPSKPGHVAQADVRAIWDRDGGQCTWVGPDGRRCTATTFLQIDHVDPAGQGGSDDPSNLRLLCAVHNKLHAEHCYGKEHVERAIRCRREQRRAKKEAARNETAPLPVFERASHALVGMGFSKPEVRRAIETIGARHENDPDTPPLDLLIREGIAALT